MAEGPVSFGKPLVILVILGCAGAGYWAYKNWPSHYDGAGWSVDWPNKWETTPANDASRPGKVVASGNLKVEEHGQGVGWGWVNFHGSIHLPTFTEEKLGYPLENVVTGTDIDNKTALIFEYEEPDKNFRFLAASVERMDAVVMVAIGCNKAHFEENKPHFEKVIKSIKCFR